MAARPPTVRDAAVTSGPRPRGRGTAVKIIRVVANNRARVFEVRVGRRILRFPYAKVDPPIPRSDHVRKASVDRELAGEAFSFSLASGRDDAVHVEQVLEYNRDPDLLRERVLYAMTIEAQSRFVRSSLANREIIRRLSTSASQLDRLLDQTNYHKTIDQLLRLLQALDCEVDLLVRSRTA